MITKVKKKEEENNKKAKKGKAASIDASKDILLLYVFLMCYLLYSS